MDLISNDYPAKTAIKLNEMSLDYAELKNKIHAMSTQLKKLPKALLILNSTTSIDFIIQLMAAISIGQPVALFSAQWTEEEKRSRKAAMTCDIMTIDAQGKLSELHNKINPSSHHSQLSLIFFTSGSTGQIKAVQLSRENIESCCRAVIKALQFSQVRDQLLFLPLSYCFGLLGQFLPGLMAGITTHLVSQFTDAIECIESGIVPEMWSGVPSHWVVINTIASQMRDSAEKIKFIVSAGAPLPITLRGELRKNFPNAVIFNNYGLTEASSRVLSFSSDDPLFMEDYAGYPVGDWKLKLTEDQELFIQGNQVMLGYLGDEDHSKIQDGWLATGDLAEILPSGLVAIRGRRDNLVKVSGEKVNLAEMEQNICKFEKLKEVGVVPLSDPLYGVSLVVCIEKGSIATGLTEKNLAEILQQHFLPRKLPISVRFIDKMPHNQNGKIDRKELLAIVMSPTPLNNTTRP